MSIREIGANEANMTRWLSSSPHMWPEREEDWHGQKFFGTGAFGCAGLWCHVDENENIDGVSGDVKSNTASNTGDTRISVINSDHWRKQNCLDLKLRLMRVSRIGHIW